MASMNISLPDPMRDWVEAQIEQGRYSSNSDYVRDLIRRDQDAVRDPRHPRHFFAWEATPEDDEALDNAVPDPEAATLNHLVD